MPQWHSGSAAGRPGFDPRWDRSATLESALCESFLATLEYELLDRVTFRTRAEARRGVFEFIEGWYTTRRRHSALDYLSPIEYARKHCATS